MCKAVCLHAKFNEERRGHENVTGQTGCDVMAVNLEHPARPFPCDSVSTEVRMLLVFWKQGPFGLPQGKVRQAYPRFPPLGKKLRERDHHALLFFLMLRCRMC